MKINKISKDKINIENIGDQELFWSIENGKVVKSSPDFNITKGSQRNVLAERQIYKVYGNRPPYPLTLKKNLFRLLPGLPLEVDLRTKVVFNKLTRPLDTINNNWSIQNYYQAFESALKSNKKYKIIFMSSGWDSSSILAALVKKYGPRNIIPITLSLNYGLKDPVNKFELLKAKKICHFFGVKLRIVPSIYFEKKLLEAAFSALRKNSLYNLTAINHWTLWRAVEKMGLSPRKTVVYAGEFSDGAHNFGFSQNFSAIYPEKGYRQYADKVRSYFISPSFLRRIQTEKNIANDELVKRFMPGKILQKEKSPQALCKKLLVGMFFNDDRGPFSTSKTSPHDEKMKREYELLMKNLFPKKPDQLYASILEFYKRHHWQGSTVMGLRSLMPAGYELKLPFGDKKIIKLLANMPTRYGRGLEPEPTKYPLKMYCKTQVRYPLDIQEGPHSYVYDANQAISLYQLTYTRTKCGKIIRKYFEGKKNLTKKFKNIIYFPKKASPKEIEIIYAKFLSASN